MNTSEPPARKTITERVETVSKILSNIGGLFVPVAVAYFAYVLNQSNMDRTNTNTVTAMMLKYEASFTQLNDQSQAALIRSLQAVGTDPAVINGFLAAAAKTTDPSVRTDLQTLAAQASPPWRYHGDRRKVTRSRDTRDGAASARREGLHGRYLVNA